MLHLSPELLPTLQAMFLQAVLPLHLGHQTASELGSVPSMLFHVLQRIGAFKQSIIHTGTRRDWLSSELYQR